jgi:hypothetical protein
MARVLGYGGIANTNGVRDFSGKEAFAPVAVLSSGGSYAKYYGRSYHGVVFALLLHQVWQYLVRRWS